MLPLQQARFPDFRLKGVGFTAFPISTEISDHLFGSYALPVHSGGNRLGISPNFPCHPLWAPATVQFGFVGAKLEQQLLLVQRTKQQINVVCEPRHSMSGPAPLSRRLATGPSFRHHKRVNPSLAHRR